MRLFPGLDVFVRGTLLLFDKGFVAYGRLHQIDAAGLLYLCPMRLNGNAIVMRARRAPKYVYQALRDHPEGVWLRDLLPSEKQIGKAWDLDVVVWPKTAARAIRQLPTRLVIVPGPKQKQRPYLTNLAASQWSPRALAELYRLRWQVELVFKEMKQHLSLESLPSKDRFAVQVFAWASLIALALSRTVTSCMGPLMTRVGLRQQLRPALVTRALRSNIRVLARALIAAKRRASEWINVLVDDLSLEIRARDRGRRDSFERLIFLLPAG